MSVKPTIDNLNKVLAAMNRLDSTDVLVGIPSDDDTRLGGGPKGANERKDHGPMTNAVLGYIHEHGAPEAGIPARPWLVPGALSVKGEVATLLGTAAKRALDGDENAVLRGLHAAGLTAQAGIRNYLSTAPFTPLADATLAGRARRGRKGAAEELARRAAGEDASNDSARPLVDTAQLRNSVGYVLRKRGE